MGLNDPIIVTDAPVNPAGVTREIIAEAKARNAAGDRGGAYMLLYQATGEAQ